MRRLEIALLGSFQVSWEGEPVTDFETEAARLLLAYLAIHAGRAIRREVLADLFWAERPRKEALHALRQTLHRLRRALGAEGESAGILKVTPQSIAFDAQSNYWLDVQAFKNLLQGVQQHPHRRLLACRPCMRRLSQAAELYRGELLSGFHHSSLPFQEWLVMERESLHRKAMEVFFHLSNDHAQRGEYEAAERYARRQLAAEPWCEEAHRQLMTALAASGKRAAALSQFETCRRILSEELKAEPELRTRRLFEQIAAGIVPSATPRHNLPSPITRFWGREAELEQIAELLNMPGVRLLTLVGPGGVGKTRLALEAGRQVIPNYPDGVWFVSLAAFSDPDQVAPAVATAFGVREENERPLLQQLAEQLQGKCLLLILDGCEHLVVAVRRVAERLLQSAAEVQLLVTSRKVLGTAGETVWPVQPLQVPGPTVLEALAEQLEAGLPSAGQSIRELLHCESVAVFADRAASVQPTFTVTPENALAVGRICQRLDGLPLALELAAALIKALTPQQIADHLRDALDLLKQGSPAELPRQQSLQATLDWSHGLLSREQQILLRRCSVFAGSFTLPAAEAVCTGAGLEQRQVLDCLIGLVNQSLVNVQPRGEVARYYLHEVTRQYAHLHLQEAGEEPQVRNRHLAFYCRLAEELEGTLSGILSRAAADVLRVEYDNLQAALAWSLHLHGDAPSGLRLAAALPNFWEVQGRFSLERGWLELLLMRAGTTGDPALRAKALRAAGRLAYYQCALEAAQDYFLQSAALDREQENWPRLADTLGRLGLVYSTQQEFAAAESVYRESLVLYQALGEQSGAARILSELAYVALRQGDLGRGRRLLEESLVLFQEPEDLYLISRARLMLGRAACLEGDYPRARSLFTQALTALREIGNSWGMFYLLEAFGCLALLEGELERAVRLWGAVERLGEVIGTSLPPAEQAEHERSVMAARQQLEPSAFAAAWEAGRRMTLDDAITCALEPQ